MPAPSRRALRVVVAEDDTGKARECVQYLVDATLRAANRQANEDLMDEMIALRTYLKHGLEVK